VVSTTGGDVEYWVEYGPTTAYGSETPHQTVNVTQGTFVAVRPAIGGLQRSTTYHYRVCAQDSSQEGGPGCGEDRTFTTQSAGCDDTLTADIRLTGDLDCEGFGTAFAIGAPGIEVDLAGHTILGGQGAGIDNSAGHDDLVVRDGSIAGASTGTGILAEGASRNRFLDLDVRAAGAAISIRGGERNEVRRSNLAGQFGVDAQGSDRLVVADSEATALTLIGIRVEGDLARVVRNRVPTLGGPFSFPSGIRIAGNGNLVRRNLVEGPWKEGGGIGVLSGSDNKIVANEVSGGENDGILVEAFTAGTLLRGNFVHGNGDDGIDVQAPDTRLRRNRADDNGDFGIDAVTDVTDLGGNTATGNGNPLQCRNVFCP
jgi:Right handed beta helix region